MTHQLNSFVFANKRPAIFFLATTINVSHRLEKIPLMDHILITHQSPSFCQLRIDVTTTGISFEKGNTLKKSTTLYTYNFPSRNQRIKWWSIVCFFTSLFARPWLVFTDISQVFGQQIDKWMHNRKKAKKKVVILQMSLQHLLMSVEKNTKLMDTSLFPFYFPFLLPLFTSPARLTIYYWKLLADRKQKYENLGTQFMK